MKHYYPKVPRLGNVAISRHAQKQAETAGISEQMVTDALTDPDGPDIPDHQGIVFRDRGLVRLVIILKPEPFAGACLVKTIIRKKPQQIAK